MMTLELQLNPPSNKATAAMIFPLFDYNKSAFLGVCHIIRLNRVSNIEKLPRTIVLNIRNLQVNEILIADFNSTMISAWSCFQGEL